MKKLGKLCDWIGKVNDTIKLIIVWNSLSRYPYREFKQLGEIEQSIGAGLLQIVANNGIND